MQSETSHRLPQRLEESARYVGAIPAVYDRQLGPILFKPFAVDLAHRLPGYQFGTVLETACGTGILTSQLRRRLRPCVELVGTDFNRPMLDFAKKKLHALQNICWKQADATELPFASASFRAVVCQFGLMFCQNKAAAFSEARRVLIDGGFFGFSVWDGLDTNPFAAIGNAIVCRALGADAPRFFDVAFGFNDRFRLQELLNERGFEDVRFEPVTRVLQCRSAKMLAHASIIGTPVGLAIKDLGAECEPIIDAIAEQLARVGGDAPFCTTMQALVVTARARGGKAWP